MRSRMIVFIVSLVIAAFVAAASAERASALFDLTYDADVTVTTTGSGTVTGVGFNCPGDCTQHYSWSIFDFFSPSVTLTANPGVFQEFDGWGGACAFRGTNTTCTLIMSGGANLSVSASFSPFLVIIGTYTDTLTVNTAGIGSGTVTSSANGNDGTPLSCVRAGDGAESGDCVDSFDFSIFIIGAFDVTLTPTPGPNAFFTGWSGDCTGTGLATVNIAAGDKTCTATFGAVTYDLGVSVNGAGNGTIQGPGINCPGDCVESFAAGTAVMLLATPAPGSDAGGWTNDCVAFGTGLTCNVTMTAARSAGFVFKPSSGGGSACDITGTPGDDILIGTSADETICGLGGNDVIRGGGGDDILLGAGGNDKLYGGAGADELNGGNGKDKLYGEAGSDTLLGGTGADTLAGGAGPDILKGGPGIDIGNGGGANDVCAQLESQISCP